METAPLEAASNGTEMSHMFLARTCTHSSVSSQKKGQLGSGMVEQLCEGQTSRVSVLRFLGRLLLMVTKTKTHQNTPTAGCRVLVPAALEF